MLFTEDIHVHTKLSNCAEPTAIAADYLRQAKELGYDLIGFADHLWDERIPVCTPWYSNQNVPHVVSLREELRSVEPNGVQVLVGAECEYDAAHRDIAITKEGAEQLDFLIVPNSHTHITYGGDRQDRPAHADFMMQAFWDILESPCSSFVTAVAHPFCAVCCPYPPEELLPLYTDDALSKAFTAAAKKGIAMEFNPCVVADVKEEGDDALRKTEWFRLFSAMKDCGCRFTFGSDRHTAIRYHRYPKLERFAELVGITEADMVRKAGGAEA